MIACAHVRQVPDHNGGMDGYVETYLDGILPCAEPRCPASVAGEGLDLFCPNRPVKHFTREATPDGWRWVRQP